VVWDGEGEEGMMIIQRKGMGRKDKGRKQGKKEGRRKEITWPQTKFLDPPLIVSAQPAV
jgi:hypothetical protein